MSLTLSPLARNLFLHFTLSLSSGSLSLNCHLHRSAQMTWNPLLKCFQVKMATETLMRIRYPIRYIFSLNYLWTPDHRTYINLLTIPIWYHGDYYRVPPSFMAKTSYTLGRLSWSSVGVWIQSKGIAGIAAHQKTNKTQCSWRKHIEVSRRNQ